MAKRLAFGSAITTWRHVEQLNALSITHVINLRRNKHGNTVLRDKKRTDVIALSPAQILPVSMVPDDPGAWMYHCHVSDHMHGGMTALYEVKP